MIGTQDASLASRSSAGDPVGTVITCSRAGEVIRVIRDDLGLFPEGESTALTGLVDRDSRMKLKNFLAEVGQQGYAFNWEIIYRMDGSLKVLTTSGLADSDQYWLVVGDHPAHTDQIVRESLNHLKEALPDELWSEVLNSKSGMDRFSFEEITRINSELVSLQRVIQQQKLDLEALNEEKDRFLSLAAHDLRNPLAAIISYADFLIDDLDDHLDEEHRQFLDSIQSQSRYLLNLIEDLLDVSIISLGGMTLKKERLGLADLISESVGLNQVLARKKGIELCWADQSTDLLLVEVDSTKFKQVLNNLLSNGIKFCPSGSVIEVEARQEGTGVQVLVRDNGPGIPGEELDRLFKLFQRTSVTSTDGEKSTGLGLAIARNIVQMHGGELTVNSQPGAGTEFRIDIPGSGR
jgi:signal transduction histidine kinase